MLLKSRSSTRLFAAAVSVAVIAAPTMAGDIRSDLFIEPAQFFELGGGQPGSFTVTGRNTGPLAVVVYSLAEDEEANLVERGTVAPGDRVDATFGPGQMAVLRNTSTMETARLMLRISGDTSSLGITYSADPVAKRKLNPR